MGSFIGRTRLRGTIDYRPAEWLDDYFGTHKYGVRFLDDPTGHVYRSEEVHLAGRANKKEDYEDTK